MTQHQMDPYLEQIAALSQHHLGMMKVANTPAAAAPAGPGFLERGANYLGEGFQQLAGGALNPAPSAGGIGSQIKDNFSRNLVQHAGNLQKPVAYLSWYNKIRPGAGAAFDAFVNPANRKALAAAGTLGVGALGAGGLLYGAGKALFGGNSHPQYPQQGYY